MKQLTDILIVGVIYNTYQETIRYLESTLPFREQGVKVILVDNSDQEIPGYFKTILDKNPEVIYLHTLSNIGYFHGAALGLDHFVQENGGWPSWTLVTNVDILFPDPQMIEKIRANETIPELGVIAPKILSARWGTDYNPGLIKKYSLTRLRFYQAIYSLTLLNNLYIGLSYLKKLVQGYWKRTHSGRLDSVTSFPVEIFGPHGSCILFNRNYFSRGGTLNHISFLYGEEIFVAETAKKLALKVMYDPRIRIDDFEHASTGMFLSRRMTALCRQSIKDLIKNYYQPI